MAGDRTRSGGGGRAPTRPNAKTDAKSDKGMRVKRVEESVREELSALVGTEVKDPRAAGAIVTRVQMASDLRSARVHIRVLDDHDDVAHRREVVETLRRASGMLRREVTQRLGLRFAPELKFQYDDGVDQVTSVERVLAEIAAERKSH
jgi:ribosome-binding factor A